MDATSRKSTLVRGALRGGCWRVIEQRPGYEPSKRWHVLVDADVTHGGWCAKARRCLRGVVGYGYGPTTLVETWWTLHTYPSRAEAVRELRAMVRRSLRADRGDAP